MKYDGAESSTLEFKQELPKNDQITKTVIGFCNRHGGRLVIGVANDGTVVGIDANEADKLMEYIDKMIYESTSPPIIPLVYTRQLHGKTLFDSVSEITISDVINILHIPRSTAGRRLAGLVNKKLLIRSGKGKGVKYKYKQ